MTVDDFFKPDGIIASVKPGFAPRPGQVELAKKLLECMENSTHSISEAPTGFGKSYAALVPAIIYVLENPGKRVVVSTETLTLQDQYIRSDLPLLQQAVETVTGEEFSFAKAAGRNNYVCKRKSDFISGDQKIGRTELHVWADNISVENSTGDIADIPCDFTREEWAAIGADDECERKACPYYKEGVKGDSDCFVYAAKREFLEANIVVTNHTMLLLDLALGGGILLGAYDALLVDEGHSLPDRAVDCWGKQIKSHTISTSIAKSEALLKRSNVMYALDEQTRRYIEEGEAALFAPFRSVKEFSIGLNELPKVKVESARNAALDLMDDLKGINVSLRKIKVFDEDDGRTIAIDTVIEKNNGYINTLGAVFGDKVDAEYKDNWLSYLEVMPSKAGKWNGTLHLKPIEVAPLMKTMLLDFVPSVNLMSATMQVNGTFYFIKREMGMSKEVPEFVGQSPFNFAKQVRGYYPRHMPDSSDRSYTDALANEIDKIVTYHEGRTLVLFTNSSVMRDVYNMVDSDIGNKYEVMIQGQASKSVLIDRMKEDTGAVLFATRSFFTGVDIPGAGLSCVVLVKAPFKVPSDPMFKARCQKIEAKQGNSFRDLSLPLMLFDIKQSFGRLTRTETDTGMFAFLDSRAMNKSYWRDIRSALPAFPSAPTLSGEATRNDLDK